MKWLQQVKQDTTKCYFLRVNRVVTARSGSGSILDLSGAFSAFTFRGRGARATLAQPRSGLLHRGAQEFALAGFLGKGYHADIFQVLVRF